MRRLPPFLFLVGVFLVLFAGAPDWQTLSTQGGENRRFFYTTSGALVTTGAEFRAYILGADTSNADNQFDGVLDGTTGGWDFDVPRDTWVAIYRIDGTDVLYEATAFLNGDYGGKGAADDTTIAAGKVTSVHLADSTITGAKIATGALATSHFSAATIPGTALEANAVTPGKMATGQQFFSQSSTDSIEVAVASAVIVQGVAGGPVELNGSGTFDGPLWSVDAGTIFDFGDSIRVVGGARVDGSHLDINSSLIELGSASNDSILARAVARFAARVNFTKATVWTDSVTDTMLTTQQIDTLLVPGVSDLIADGYAVRCYVQSTPTFYVAYNYWNGVNYRREFAAGPFSQTAATGDSVYVIVDAVMAIDLPITCRCWGEDVAP